MIRCPTDDGKLQLISTTLHVAPLHGGQAEETYLCRGCGRKRFRSIVLSKKTGNLLKTGLVRKKSLLVKGKFEIIDAKWTKDVNMLKIKCVCGRKYWHRADKSWFRCKCGSKVYTLELKRE